VSRAPLRSRVEPSERIGVLAVLTAEGRRTISRMSGDEETNRIGDAVRAKMAERQRAMTDTMTAEVILELYGNEPSRASVDRVLAYVAELRADSAA